MSFWEKLPKPFSVLAPMEDVTDTVFRRVVCKAGKPHVMFTEFTSVDGIEHAVRNLFSTSPQPLSLFRRGEFIGGGLDRLMYSEMERPMVAQIWGKEPEKFSTAARLIKDLGFDGIDINMGCPDRAVMGQGCGAALIGENAQAAEIVEAVKEGGKGLPVSAKTRLGNKEIEKGWMEFLLEQDLAALTVHARTAKEMSLVPANWATIKEIVNSKSKILRTKIIGNGDIKSLDDPRIAESGVDGVMVGRGVFENPFLFSKSKFLNSKDQKIQNLKLLKYHLNLWEETWGKKKNFAMMKKFFKMYVREWDGAGELRAKLMETKSVEESLKILN